MSYLIKLPLSVILITISIMGVIKAIIMLTKNPKKIKNINAELAKELTKKAIEKKKIEDIQQNENTYKLLINIVTSSIYKRTQELSKELHFYIGSYIFLDERQKYIDKILKHFTDLGFKVDIDSKYLVISWK